MRTDAGFLQNSSRSHPRQQCTVWGTPLCVGEHVLYVCVAPYCWHMTVMGGSGTECVHFLLLFDIPQQVTN